MSLTEDDLWHNLKASSYIGIRFITRKTITTLPVANIFIWPYELRFNPQYLHPAKAIAVHFYPSEIFQMQSRTPRGLVMKITSISKGEIGRVSCLCIGMLPDQPLGFYSKKTTEKAWGVLATRGMRPAINGISIPRTNSLPYF